MTIPDVQDYVELGSLAPEPDEWDDEWERALEEEAAEFYADLLVDQAKESRILED